MLGYLNVNKILKYFPKIGLNLQQWTRNNKLILHNNSMIFIGNEIAWILL